MSTFTVEDGSRLLAGWRRGADLSAHRRAHGDLPRLDRDALLDLVAASGLRGRGGAAFPFARKLRSVVEAAGPVRRPVLVVNWAEGEPASYKDRALATVRPHLVLDGAELTAHALGVREVHLVLPHDAAAAGAVRSAVAERPERPRWVCHQAADRFVSGQSTAVLQLMAGRPNLPVTAWQPTARSGHRRRPTLLSNAETWAQLAAAALPATAGLPPTTLLTWDGEGAPVVREVALGSPWRDVLPASVESLLIGGYHGTWVRTEELAGQVVDHEAMSGTGVPLGAGVLLPVALGECTVTMTARITSYLAGQSAGRCGPCVNGLPALARAVQAVADGGGPAVEAMRLVELVTGRGACAHPDGTARLVASLLATHAGEVARHLDGGCALHEPLRAVS